MSTQPPVESHDDLNPFSDSEEESTQVFEPLDGLDAVQAADVPPAGRGDGGAKDDAVGPADPDQKDAPPTVDMVDLVEVELQAAVDVEAAGLQHWTAPATGQIPAVLLEKDGVEKSSLRGPTWQDGDSDWSGPGLAELLGSPDGNTGDGSAAANGVARRERTRTAQDEIERRRTRMADSSTAPADPTASASSPVDGHQVGDELPGSQSAHEARADHDAGQGIEMSDSGDAPGKKGADQDLPSIDDIKFVDYGESSRPSVGESNPGSDDLSDLFTSEPPGSADKGSSRDNNDGDFDLDSSGIWEEDDEAGGGRSDLVNRIAVGVALSALAIGCLSFGPLPALLLVTVVGVLAVLELFNAMRQASLRPATLLGMVATLALPLVVYSRGAVSVPLVLSLIVVFGCLWYLVGADTERPVLNLALTLLGVLWIGGLGSFSALMLRVEGGVGLLLTTIILVAASDIGAYLGGRAYGSTPFHHASPNKTWEGTLTGFIAATFVGLVIGLTDSIAIFDSQLLAPVVAGAVVGVLGPIGDLSESMVKRDLGVKDMGRLLPGHGGVFDRVDALLFALPGMYYTAAVFGFMS